MGTSGGYPLSMNPFGSEYSGASGRKSVDFPHSRQSGQLVSPQAGQTIGVLPQWGQVLGAPSTTSRFVRPPCPAYSRNNSFGSFTWLWLKTTSTIDRNL